MSHLLNGVASLSDDDNNHIKNVPTRGAHNQEKVKTAFLKANCTTSSETLIFTKEDEEEKKHLSGQDKDIEASTNADSSENFGKKTKASAHQKRNRREKKKERKGTFQFDEEEKQFESNPGTQTTIGDKSEYIFKAEKPALIKTLTLDQDEYEIALEAFLNNEYQGDPIIIPPNSNQNLNNYHHTENVNYKLKLVNPSQERIEHLTNQMKLRLQEGHGEAKYEIGLGSDGTAIGLNRDEMFNSLKTLCTLASNLKADVIILRMRNGQQGKTAEVLVRSNQKDGIKLDMKIMLLGDQQCGKSTLIGVLTSGKLDDGRGSARKYVHVHKHDVMSGETSSLSHHILGFDSQGNVTNHTETGHASWEQIVDTSTKILTFLDIGGHEKYTTKIVSGLCSFYPDYTLIVVSAVQGITAMAEKHLKLACVFGVPFIIAVTHADLATQKDLFDLRSIIERTLRKYCEGKYLIVANNEEDNVILSRTLKENIGIPVFMLSCVKGTNMDLFKSFLNLLPVNNTLSTNINLHSEFYIHTTFNKDNKLILGGTVIKGCIKKHQILFLGPDEKGKFRHIEVASLQCKKVSVQRVYCGQSCTIEIKMGKFAQQWLDSSREAIRRGMVLVDLKSNPKAAIEFTAEISLFEEKSTKAILWEGYEPVIISQTTHQVCTIDFDQIKPEEIKEEDLQKLKEFTDSLSHRQPPKRTVPKDEFGLPILKLGKQKSKSQDFRDFQAKKTVEGEPFGKSPERKQSSFSRRKIANVILTTNDMAMKASNFISDSGEEKITKKKNFKQPSDQAPAHLKQLFDEVDQNNNMSVKEKIKNVKKTIYMYAEDFAPKRKQQIKFITIKPGEIKVLRFRFKYHSEYITRGQKIIINDSSMKSVGTIRDIVYIDPKT